MQSECKKSNWFAARQLCYWNHFCKYLLWLDDLIQIFLEILSYLFFNLLIFLLLSECTTAYLLHPKISAHVDLIVHKWRASSSFLLKSTHKNEAISSTRRHTHTHTHNRANMQNNPANGNTPNLCSSLLLSSLEIFCCTKWLHLNCGEYWWTLCVSVCFREHAWLAFVGDFSVCVFVCLVWGCVK